MISPIQIGAVLVVLIVAGLLYWLLGLGWAIGFLAGVIVGASGAKQFMRRSAGTATPYGRGPKR